MSDRASGRSLEAVVCGIRRLLVTWVLSRLLAGGSMTLAGPAAFCDRAPIFPANSKHNHASCVVELKDGSLLAAWYAGSGERTADDVVIEGAWLAKGKTAWGPKFLMADTPGYPDCNPALFAAPDGSLWLFWPTILDHRWEGALLKYARCEQPTGEPAPLEMVAVRRLAHHAQRLRSRDASARSRP